MTKYEFRKDIPVVVRQPADWVRGGARFGSIDRHLQGYAFDAKGLRKMGCCWPVTTEEAMKVDEWCKKNGIVPKEAFLECFATLISQDLVAFRWEHWEYPAVYGASMISIEFKDVG